MFSIGGQLDGDGESWDEIDESQFYEMLYLDHCLWYAAPYVQDLAWRHGELLEEIDGVTQMRKGIAKSLQNYSAAISRCGVMA